MILKVEFTPINSCQSLFFNLDLKNIQTYEDDAHLRKFRRKVEIEDPSAPQKAHTATINNKQSWAERVLGGVWPGPTNCLLWTKLAWRRRGLFAAATTELSGSSRSAAT
jgi:hypothetical protein